MFAHCTNMYSAHCTGVDMTLTFPSEFDPVKTTSEKCFHYMKRQMHCIKSDMNMFRKQMWIFSIPFCILSAGGSYIWNLADYLQPIAFEFKRWGEPCQGDATQIFLIITIALGTKAQYLLRNNLALKLPFQNMFGSVPPCPPPSRPPCPASCRPPPKF